MSDWTQPQCVACWTAVDPDRRAYRMQAAQPERCAFCGAFTGAGIYVRVDPATVPYPTFGSPRD